MQYILLFLEGVITFISPCLLPMLPLYISYFAGGNSGSPGNHEADTGRVLVNASGFVLGFTIVFVILGAFAGSIGWLLRDYSTVVNLVTGLVVVVIGLNYLGIISFGFIPGVFRPKQRVVPTSLKFHSAVLFGVVLSISWTPCVGAFLGAALMRASMQGSVVEGMFMLFVYSMGLGLPFIASALLIDRLKGAFGFIKKHYRVVNGLSGGLLVLIGIFMMTGLFGRYMALFAQ